MRLHQLSALATAASATTSRTTAPSGSITVCSSGCDFAKIQGAVSSLSTSSTTAQSIFIGSGTYTEQVTVPVLAGKLTIYGETTDTSSYLHNVVNLEWTSSILTDAVNDEETAALINLSPNVDVYNINIKNLYGKGSQAIALAAYNSEQGYYGVGLYGYQDTLLAQIGNQVYAGCYIEGAVDFIFGQHARIWVTQSRLAATASGGSITANGRSTATDTSYFVIDQSTINASDSGSVPAGTVYLGRPWTKYARVVYQLSSLSSIINSAGWTVWSSTENRTAEVTFEECQNSGTGAAGPRAKFSSLISSPITIDTILGSTYGDWVDTTYL